MPVVSQMVRAALMVSDLERARDFYEDVLGLTEVYSAGTAVGGNMYALMGVPETVTTRACVLQIPGKPSYGMVGLFEVKQPAPPALPRVGTGCNIGEMLMVFYCEDLDEITRKMNQRGLPIVAGPIPLRIRGHVKQREMTICGYDGEKINLIEWKVAKADAGERPEKWVGVPE